MVYNNLNRIMYFINLAACSNGVHSIFSFRSSCALVLCYHTYTHILQLVAATAEANWRIICQTNARKYSIKHTDADEQDHFQLFITVRGLHNLAREMVVTVEM